jgi:pimeloyl-ACP methyl ester carboxylesterase
MKHLLTKLTMPVLSIGGEKSLGNALAQQMKLAATNVTGVVLKDRGHWILEEKSQGHDRRIDKVSLRPFCTGPGFSLHTTRRHPERSRASRGSR